MHLELKKESIKIVPDTIQDQVFLEEVVLRSDNKDQEVLFIRRYEADTFYLESE